jgi:hypothetical protein
MLFTKGQRRPGVRNLCHGRVGLLFAACLILGSAAGCKKTVMNTTPTVVSAPSIFKPAPETQNKVVASISISGLEGTLAKVGTLSSKLGLPFGTEQLRQMLIAQSGLPPALLAHLDLAQPVGSAMIGREKDKSPFTAVAAAAKSAKDAVSFIAEMGTKVGEDKGAIHVKMADGSEQWVYAAGLVLVGSDSLEGLQAAGAQAMAARQTKGEDFVATVFPSAIAMSQGTELRKALTDGRAALMAAVREQSAKTPSPMPVDVTEKLLAALLDPYIDQLADTQSVDLAMAVDPAVGLKFLGRIHPIAGSKFSKSISKVIPYEVDPALAAAPLKAGFFAIRYSPEMLTTYGEALSALGEMSLPGLKALAHGSQTLIKALSGHTSGTFTFDGGMNYNFVAPLLPETDPNAVMAAADELFGPQGMGALIKESAKQLPKGSKLKIPQVSWKRQGLKGRVEFPMSFGLGTKEEKQMRMLFGGDKLSYLIAVAGGKLYGIMGPQADADLVSLSTTTAKGVDPDVQQVLNETKGREGFAYMDIFGFVRPIMASMAKTEPSLAQANAMLSFIPGVEKLRVPMIMSYVGGNELTGEWFIPLRAFENVATIVRPLMGMAGGGGDTGGALAPGAQ